MKVGYYREILPDPVVALLAIAIPVNTRYLS